MILVLVCDNSEVVLLACYTLNTFIKFYVYLVFNKVIDVLEYLHISVSAKVSYLSVKEVEVIFKSHCLDVGRSCGVKLSVLTAHFKVYLVNILHKLDSLFLAGKCVKVTAEIVCDVIFAVRHSACTAEAVHNGAYLAVNAGLNFFAIYRTLTLADRSALINNANFYVFVKLDKFVCHEYAGCTCTDNNYVIILSHNYFLSNQNPVYFYP